jgi:predicted methyltransferase
MFRKIAVSALVLSLAACASAPAPRTAADYAGLLSANTRLETERADDAARKPAEVLAFMNLHAGQTIFELEAGRGYYTELLAGAVGPTGKVIMHNPAEFPNNVPWIAARTAGNRLPNVRTTASHFDALDAPAASVDKVVWILGPHEVFYTPRVNGQPAAIVTDPAKAYSEIFRVLKPGGEFIAMDHAADAGAPTTTGQTIHRVDPAVVRRMAEAAGLVFVDASPILANPQDDRTKMVFDPTIRRHTDQFLFRFRKPA